MLEAALNTKLIKFCTCVGLLERHTCYSTRRSAIIETSHTHGSEQAKDGALHKPTGNSLFSYDNVGFGDMDITTFRLGGETSMNRDHVRETFSQAASRTTLPEAA
jgi:hypothetical protein